MKPIPGLSGRPPFYDRTPLSLAFNYGATTIPPHALTSRWTYTVPTGRKFQVGELCAILVRDAVAGTVGEADALLRFTPNAGAFKNVLEALTYSNLVDGGRQITLGGSATAIAGDNWQGMTLDVSVTGSFTYSVSMLGTEFDA